MENLFLIHLVFVFANLFVITATSQINIESPPPAKHVPLFMFGDSLFDTGNNNYLKNAGKANFFPYGESFFKFPTGRFSDGRIIPDFIAEYLKLPRYVPPYLQPGNCNYTNGVDFASGGAGALVETHKGTTIDLKSQVGYFKKVRMQLRKRFGAKAADKLLSKAIFLINIGINDYNWQQFSKNSSCFDTLVCKKEFVKMVASNISALLQEIHENGGRKFAISNVAPLGCLPHSRAVNHGECLNKVSSVVKMHNIQLEMLLKSLQVELQDFQYLYFNLHDSLTQRIHYPSSYGFKEVKAACCGVGAYRGMGNCGGKEKGREKYELCEDPNTYLFFDGHPTQKDNKQLAHLLWSGKNKRFIKPYNLQHFSHVDPKEFNKL